MATTKLEAKNLPPEGSAPALLLDAAPTPISGRSGDAGYQHLIALARFMGRQAAVAAIHADGLSASAFPKELKE